MNHWSKQNYTLQITKLFLLIITAFLISSCCKDNDCSCGTDVTPQYWEFFIAHAGGGIDGNIYTNSLEALDLSYSKGCRLFELDLTLTTDNKIVGIHDAPGQTEAEFMAQKILGKYTPLNMDAINRWFQNHPNAILVTDKLEDPQRIFDEFLFRDRVIMELFSWEAVDKAIELGITPLVSENLIYGWSKKAMEMGIMPTTPRSNTEFEQVLKDKKIKYIGMNRTRIAGNENFLSRLKKNGIKNYVWDVEYPIHGQPPEQYVWNYEMNFCYGMYANTLDVLIALLGEKRTTK